MCAVCWTSWRRRRDSRGLGLPIVPLVLTHANLIDCVNPGVTADTDVVIDAGRIIEIGGGGSTSSGNDTRVVDLRGAFLLPGLWDVHIHPEYPVPPGMTVAQETANFGRQLSFALTEAGITSVRCGGAAHFMDVAWKRAFAAGGLIGPRVFASGYFLTTTGGHFLTSGQARECDGPYGFVQAIREQIKNGVDHIKLNLTGGIMGPDWDRHWHSFLLEDELAAAFAISRQREFPVMAHAANPDAVKSAVRLGAHSVEHGYIMDEDCISALTDSQTWYVPTLAISHLTEGQAQNEYEKRWLSERNIAADLQCRADAAAEEHARWFRRALDAGVPMALGSDIRPLREAALLEMGLWVRDGATAWQTLLAATCNAAALCGVGSQLGTVEAGKLADLIVVGSNPLEDINNLRQLQLVIKEGRIVSDQRPSR